jgi:hypothetical protein
VVEDWNDLFCKKRPLLVDFKTQTRAQKTRAQQGSNFTERGFQPAWANIAYEVYVAILGLRHASETVE